MSRSWVFAYLENDCKTQPKSSGESRLEWLKNLVELIGTPENSDGWSLAFQNDVVFFAYDGIMPQKRDGIPENGN